MTQKTVRQFARSGFEVTGIDFSTSIEILAVQEMKRQGWKFVGYDGNGDELFEVPEETNESKLFVWHGVLCDYTNGVIFALAKNLEEAKAAVLANAPDYAQESLVSAMQGKPEIVESPKGFHLWGGG